MFKAAHPHNTHAQLLFPEYLRQSLGPCKHHHMGPPASSLSMSLPLFRSAPFSTSSPGAVGELVTQQQRLRQCPQHGGNWAARWPAPAPQPVMGKQARVMVLPHLAGITSQAPPPAHKPCFWVFTPEALSPPAVRRPFLNRSSPSIPEQEAVPVVHR